MVFEHIATGGCQSYLVGCAETCAAALIDPELSQIDRYLALAARDGLRIHYVIDTHTHADHFSATRRLAKQLGVPLVMQRLTPATGIDMRVDDGEMIVVGKLRLRVLYTPGHTIDSMCIVAGDRVFTGDTLLIGATGRTDLPTGDPEQLHDSLFGKLLQLDPALLDVRERDAFDAGRIPGARHLPRGQLELRINDELRDPTVRILTACEFGRISTLAAATLRQLGFERAVALDGGMKAWREAGYPLESGARG